MIWRGSAGIGHHLPADIVLYLKTRTSEQTAEFVDRVRS